MPADSTSAGATPLGAAALAASLLACLTQTYGFFGYTTPG